VTAANLLVPAAQYLRMSTEHQLVLSWKPVRRDSEIFWVLWLWNCSHLFRRREEGVETTRRLAYGWRSLSPGQRIRNTLWCFGERIGPTA